jgi:hypothetical protein
MQICRLILSKNSGFHTRKGLRQNREEAEESMRQQKDKQVLEDTKLHEQNLRMQVMPFLHKEIQVKLPETPRRKMNS